MSEVFFIGDTHFGHKGILKYEPEARPFETIEEMNEYMIEQWNKVVAPLDKVYHLGDFCFGRKNIEIAGRLNGVKTLIAGNHDYYPSFEYLKYFKEVKGCKQIEHFILTHVPVHPQQLEYRFWANVHGHLHSKQLDDGRYVNVSCENLPNLAPIPYEELIERATELGDVKKDKEKI